MDLQTITGIVIAFCAVIVMGLAAALVGILKWNAQKVLGKIEDMHDAIIGLVKSLDSLRNSVNNLKIRVDADSGEIESLKDEHNKHIKPKIKNLETIVRELQDEHKTEPGRKRFA